MNSRFSQEFYVYENWVVEGHKAVIHAATCSFCNHGKGIHNTTSERNRKWHGPFFSVEEAQSAARGTGGHVRFCKVCSPVD